MKMKKQRYTIKYDEEKIFQTVAIQQKDGSIVKPVIEDSKSSTHFHSYKRKDGFSHHVTNENFPKGDSRRHTDAGTTEDEPMINTTLAGLCPDGVNPPLISNIHDEQQRKKLIDFLRMTLPEMTRRPIHRQLKIPTGVVARLASSLLSASENNTDFEVDLKKEIESEDFKSDMCGTIMEDELKFPDQTWGMTMDESKVVRLLKEGIDGLVLELNLKAYLQAQESLFKKSGFDEYLNSLDIQNRITEKMKKES